MKRSAIASAAVVVAIVAVGALAARPLFELPAPTGPFPVGTVALTLHRPLEPGETSPGRFTVQLWYPALRSAGRALYGTGGGGLKGWLYHHLVQTSAEPRAMPAPRRSPLVVYVAGWGGHRTENTALTEELASHGYAVAAIGDVTRDSPVLPRVAGAADLSSERAYRATLELARERLTYESQRVSSVLDYLAAMDAGDPRGLLTGRLDLRHVGILGYSFGGAVALETCRHDKRFSAAMNLDGLLFGAGAGYHGGVPYFLVSDSMPPPTPGELASPDPVVRYMSRLIVNDEIDQGEVMRYGGYEIEVAGTRHISFTDAPLYSPRQRLREGWGKAPRITAELRTYTVAFFGHALLGTPSSLLKPGTRGRPAVTLAVGGLVAPQ